MSDANATTKRAKPAAPTTPTAPTKPAKPTGRAGALMRLLVVRLTVLQRRLASKIKGSPALRAVAHHELLSIRPAPLARGIAIGIFCAAMPIPFQMFPAALLCWLAFANLPVAIVCVWISNPFTYLPIFYVEYKLAMALFHSDVTTTLTIAEFGERYDSVARLLGELYVVIWQGALTLGAALAVAGYFLGAPLSRYLARFSKIRLK